MHATLPLKKASFPVRGRWDATACVCVEDEGASVAHAAADANDCAEVCCASITTMGASLLRMPSHRGLHLLDIFVKPTSACFTPDNRLGGVVENPLGPRHRMYKVQGTGMGALVPGALGVALCRTQRAQLVVVAPCRAQGR